MGETFLIRVNCSKILVGNEEPHYTMFVDTAKISIVYELVEWIRWIFSVENCIYLIHDDSVIHELEDIQLLSKLKNLEVKPCGQPQCIHKKIYRTLLSNFNLFVSWNEIKVHRYFVDKISQMDQNSLQKNRANDCSTIFSNGKVHQELMECNSFKPDSSKEKLISYKLLPDNQFSNSFMEHSPLLKKNALTSNLNSTAEEKEKLALKMSSCFEGKVEPKNSNVSHFEESSSFSNYLDNSDSQNLTFDSKKEKIFKTSKTTSDCAQVTNKISSKSGLSKSSDKHVRPFSVGEMLSNLRKDLTCETYSVNPSVSKKNSDEEMKTVANFFMNVENAVEVKKRQRTRKRKSKKQNLKNEMFTSSLENNDINRSLNYPKPNGSLRPNHIRFDLDDGDKLMCSEFVNDIKVHREIEYEVIQEKMEDCGFAKSEKSDVTINNCQQNLLDSQDSPFINKMEYSPVLNEQIQGEEKLIDLDDQACDKTNDLCSAVGNDQLESFNSDLNMLFSLKAKCKNAVVIQRF